MRKLASIQRVKSLEDIERDGVIADNIVLAKFKDVAWQCVVKRGEFNVGDFAVYIEVSTVLPQVEVFAWMDARKYKVKTQKIFGALSQGLALPVSILKSFGVEEWAINNVEVGDDVTEIIGVMRIEDAEPPKLSGEQKGLFPTYLVPKTDEERVQSYPEFLEFMRGKPAVATLKMDGSSCTVLVDPAGELTVCSRNFSLKESDSNAYWRMIRKTSLYKLVGSDFEHFCFQGELCGPGIQGNKLGLDDLELYIFNVINMKTNTPLSQDELIFLCDVLGLKYAPIVVEWNEFDETVESLLELARGKYPGTKNHREGLVIRPSKPEFWAKAGKWASIKVINNDFLLKFGE